MEEFVARRTKMAETKIAQAEAQALADVRAAAADAAVAAAEKILTQTVKGKVADDLIDKGIDELKTQAQLSHLAAIFWLARALLRQRFPHSYQEPVHENRATERWSVATVA